MTHTRTPSVGYMTSTFRKPHEKATMHDFDLISKGHNVHMLEDSKILHKTCINILQNKNCDIKRAQNMHIPLKT